MTEVRIKREKYLNFLIDFRDEPFVKVITGIRRCGKSTLMMMFIDHLKESGVSEENILYMNMEDPAYIDITDYKDLLKYVMSKIELKNGSYLFFDEIQDIKGWEKAINSMRYSEADVYVTGSNSNLLASEFATYLSGRYVKIEVYPLSFREYIEFKPDRKNDLKAALIEYMKYGGFPYIAAGNIEESKIGDILSATYDTVFLKDVIRRNNISDVSAIENIATFIMSNIGNVTSTRSVSNYIVSKGGKITHPTVDNYIKYLESAFLIHRAKKYDVKKKDYLKAPDKLYATDIGIRNQKVNYDENDISGIIENIVFMELLFRGKRVAVGINEGNEIDFITIDLEEKHYYQVTTNLMNENVHDREVRPLMKTDDLYPRTIVVFEPYPFKNIDGIRVISLLDFLLEDF